MRIIHFSDIHCGVFPRGWRWLFSKKTLLSKRILGVANQFVRRRRKQDFGALERLEALIRTEAPDLVVFTGDMTSVGLPSEFTRASGYLERLRAASGGRLLVMPGNHDAYVDTAATRAAREEILEKFRLSGLEDGELRFQNTRLFLLDAACPRSWFSSGGVASAADLDALAAKLAVPREDGEQRILVSHFPLYTARGDRVGAKRRMVGDVAVRQWVENGWLDYCLCGHIHAPFVKTVGAFTQVCAGSLTLHQTIAELDTDKTSCRLLKI